MRTRNQGSYKLGKYRELQTDKTYQCEINVHRFKSFINNINVFLLKNLRKKRNQSPINHISMDINNSFKRFLLEKYEIGHKFQLCDDFVTDMKLLTERYINIMNESKCRFFVKPNSFMIKINNKKLFKYIGKEEENLAIERNPSISVKFITSFTSVSNEDKIFLNDYFK